MNQYVLTSGIPTAGEAFEFTSESWENTPPNWKARERYTLKGDSLEHTFEFTPLNKPFEIYSQATLSRIKN